MQPNNIIKFENPNKNWQEVNGDVTIFAEKTLFKDACLVDFDLGTTKSVDILVENKIIKKIAPAGQIEPDKQTESFPLNGNLVLPPFLNAFETLDVLKPNFNEMNKAAKDHFSALMGMKDILSGVVNYFNEVGDILLENVSALEEKDLSEISNLAAKKNKRIWLKIGQDLNELGAVDKKFGKGVVQVLEDFGILDRSWVLVGGNCLEKDDLRLLRQYGDKVVLCPLEDGQVGRRATNLKTLLDLAFSVRIGSGKAFEIDFFGFMRQILMAQWSMFEDKTWLNEKDVLLMATNEIPTLEENAQADFIVVRNSLNLYSNIFETLVWGKSKRDVLMTIVSGRILHERGDIETGEEELSYDDLIQRIYFLTRRKNNDD